MHAHHCHDTPYPLLEIERLARLLARRSSSCVTRPLTLLHAHFDRTTTLVSPPLRCEEVTG